MLGKIVSFFRKINSSFFYRLSFLGILLFNLGTMYDMRWHHTNPIRDHYFIIPHIIIYFSVFVILAGFLLLKLKGYRVPLLIFALFPFMSIFDDLWHRFFGIELATSPMMFWSPAHWSFGLVMLYIVYSLIKTSAENNRTVIFLIKTIFFVNVCRFIYYLLIPLSPYSIYPDLHSIFNITVPLLFVFIPITLYKIISNQKMFIAGLFLLGSTPTNEWNFFARYDYVFATDKTLLFILLFTFLFVVSTNLKMYSYLGLSTIVTSFFFLLAFLMNIELNIDMVFFSFVISIAFIIIYYITEEIFLNYLQKKGYMQKIRLFFLD